MLTHEHLNMMASTQNVYDRVGSLQYISLPLSSSRPSSWESSSMTSRGRKGSTEIARQPSSQPRAWTPGWTKVHNVFRMCPICLLTTVFSLFVSPHFLKIFSLFSHPSLPPYLSLSLAEHFCLFLPDCVVMEARSHALLLAGCSVWSFCRCRGLFATLGKRRRRRRCGVVVRRGCIDG